MRQSRGFIRMLLTAVASVSSIAAQAQSVNVDAGARWHVGGAAIDFDCGSLTVAGEFAIDSAMLTGIGDLTNTGVVSATSGVAEVGGDWRNQGQVHPGNGSVHFSDQCDRPQATIEGTTTFATLDIASARGKRYALQAGQVQTVNTALRITGAADTHLVLRSTQPGARSDIALAASGGQHISWVDVADQSAAPQGQWLAPGLAAAHNAINSGNNRRWFGTPHVAQPVPASSPLLLMLLALFACGLGARRLRTR